MFDPGKNNEKNGIWVGGRKRFAIKYTSRKNDENMFKTSDYKHTNISKYEEGFIEKSDQHFRFHRPASIST